MPEIGEIPVTETWAIVKIAVQLRSSGVNGHGFSSDLRRKIVGSREARQRQRRGNERDGEAAATPPAMSTERWPDRQAMQEATAPVWYDGLC